MSEPKLIDFPIEEHEPAALEVMLASCASDAERKAVEARFTRSLKAILTLLLFS